MKTFMSPFNAPQIAADTTVDFTDDPDTLFSTNLLILSLLSISGRFNCHHSQNQRDHR